ncbi:permease of the drug/metabolite transporter (DMT) superfamily [Formosa agariphila KMM 3901]|uniref:Permease of the drug/metabolite transporter (DMT) superfamily n=1 Tax=Formosa agariphila (strain DSM 15362 / KCTC 12365 / LMG 23005 / KMM 3901 / M-2Alg 35-1) TaxID=1347342 RepID=T2KQG2_FORAG|nr:DMT family transporter [Formosa agariphila]CDF81072.1 permease of the drug/metabolite transporter (DMT) superfamily [Formosa agariphila KMM 3901]
MNKRTLALILLFLVQVFYGLNYGFANDVIDGGHIKPAGFILLRLLGATTLFWIISLFIPKEKIDKKDYLTFVAAAFFGMFLNMLSFFKGLEFTTPIHASVISTITPIVVLVLSSIYLKEKITSLKILGIILGFTGAIILSIYGKAIHSGDNILLGNSLIILNAISFSIYLIIAKKLTAKYHPLTIIKWLFLLGLIMTTPFGIQEFREVQWHTFSSYNIFAAFFVVVFATFGTYLLNVIALKHVKASTASIFVYLQPIVAAIFALIIGSDIINSVKIIAAILIFIGVYLVTKPSK